MTLRVECMESVIAPSGIIKVITDFVRGFIAGIS